jgi:ABC-type transporter Mla MlaB component
VWKAVGQGQIAIISDTPPSNPANGALWYESDSGVLFIWYNDGNSSQWVQVGGIQAGAPPPPAADNAEYVMCNGVWRLKSQTFDLAGLTQQDVAVPAWGPAKARFAISTQHPSDLYDVMRVSFDGTTFLAGASDYGQGGVQLWSNLTTVTNNVNTLFTYIIMSVAGSHLQLTAMMEMTINLTRTGGNVLFTYYGQGKTMNASAQYMTHLYHGSVQSFPANTIKALRWTTSTGVAMTSGRLNVEWLA